MKNRDEFRRLVFEKAEAYEKRRRARNKKIVSSVIITSLALALCLPVGIHVYHLNQTSFPVDTTTAASTITETTASWETTTSWATTTETFATTTATTTTATTTTTDWTTEKTYTTDSTQIETTRSETTTAEQTAGETTTVEYTTTVTETTMCENTTVESTTTVITPAFGTYELVGSCSNDAFLEYFHGVRVINNTMDSEEALRIFLEDLTALYGEEILNVMDRYDTEYFEKYELVIVQSCYRFNALVKEENQLLINLAGGTPQKGYLYFFTMKKGDTFTLNIN